MYMPGATAVGITYNGGVVFASERRIAYGNFVVSKNYQEDICNYTSSRCCVRWLGG